MCAKVQYRGTKFASSSVRPKRPELGMLVKGSGYEGRATNALVGVTICPLKKFNSMPYSGCSIGRVADDPEVTILEVTVGIP